MKIIANHAHLMPPNSWRVGDVDFLLRYMDDAGIDMTVVFPPFACQVDDNMEKANQWALDIVRQHPDRLLPAGTLFPLAPNAITLLEHLHQQGVKLIKIHPSIDLHDVADPGAKPFYTRAEELGMILDYHTGPHATRLSMSKPEKFDDLAWDYPELRFIFEHAGGRTYFEEFLAILYNHGLRREQQHKKPVVFVGLTSMLCKCPGHKIWHADDRMFQDMVQIAGADKLVFGLDFPWNSVQATRESIEAITAIDIPESDKQNMLGGNLAELLEMEI